MTSYGKIIAPSQQPALIDIGQLVDTRNRAVPMKRSKYYKKSDVEKFIHGFNLDLLDGIDLVEPYGLSMRLCDFAGVIAPDFSVYRDLPQSVKIYNTYRNFFLGAFLQRQGISVIPNIRLSGESSIPYALAGVPAKSVLAVGLHGCLRDLENRNLAKREIRWVCDICLPTAIVIYGPADQWVLEYPRELNVPLITFPSDFRSRSKGRGLWVNREVG